MLKERWGHAEGHGSQLGGAPNGQFVHKKYCPIITYTVCSRACVHVYVRKALPDQQMEKESLANILVIVQESPMAAKTSG